MELEVEEYFETLGIKRLDDIRGTTGEQFLADLDPAQLGVQLIGQLQCGVTGGEIQGDDDRSLASGHVRALKARSKSARIVADAGPVRDPVIGKIRPCFTYS
ncbi:hypothetical protein D3C80_1178200 [compost metagenome]